MRATNPALAIVALVAVMAFLSCTRGDNGENVNTGEAAPTGDNAENVITQASNCMVSMFPQMTQAGVEQEFRQQLAAGEKTVGDLRVFVEEFCDPRKSQTVGEPTGTPTPLPNVATRVAVVLKENRLPNQGSGGGGLSNISPRFGTAKAILLIDATHPPKAVDEYIVWWTGRQDMIENRVWEYHSTMEMHLIDDERGKYLAVVLLPLKNSSGYAGHYGPLSRIRGGYVVVQHTLSGTEWHCSEPKDRNLKAKSVSFGCYGALTN